LSFSLLEAFVRLVVTFIIESEESNILLDIGFPAVQVYGSTISFQKVAYDLECG
jgi:hypothetical protein